MGGKTETGWIKAENQSFIWRKSFFLNSGKTGVEVAIYEIKPSRKDTYYEVMFLYTNGSRLYCEQCPDSTKNAEAVKKQVDGIFKWAEKTKASGDNLLEYVKFNGAGGVFVKYGDRIETMRCVNHRCLWTRGEKKPPRLEAGADTESLQKGGSGGALFKITYVDKNDDIAYVLERVIKGKKDGEDAYLCDIWRFKDDFNRASARVFVNIQDEKNRREKTKATGKKR